MNKGIFIVIGLAVGLVVGGISGYYYGNGQGIIAGKAAGEQVGRQARPYRGQLRQQFLTVCGDQVDHLLLQRRLRREPYRWNRNPMG